MNRGIGALGNIFVIGYQDGVEVASQQILNILTIGTHTISVSGAQWANLTEVRVYAGDLINISLGAAFTIDDVRISDSTAPVAPVVSTVGGQTNTVRPAIAGTTEAGSTVSLVENGAIIGTAVVDATGAFTVSPTSPLGQGAHTLTVRDTDAAGNTGPASTPVVLTVDTTPPGAPSVAVASMTNDTTPAVAGTAEAGTMVRLVENGVVIGTAAVDQTGAFTVSPTTALGQGSHTFTVDDTDAAGNTGAASAPVSVTIDTTAPAAPVVTAGGGSTIDTAPAISGTAEAGSTVSLVENGVVIGTTVVGQTGSFAVSPINPLGLGSHMLTVQDTDAAGNVGAGSIPVAVTITAADTTPPLAPVVTTLGGPTNDPTPDIRGTAEAGATVSLLENGSVIGTAVVDQTGAFAVSPTNTLGDGAHTFTVQATDAASNTGPGSTPVSITVDTVAPNAPVVTSLGGPTADPTPDIGGTAEAGSTVSLIEGGMVIGAAVVGQNGGFTVSPMTALPQGAHTFTVRDTDAAGNVGPASATLSVTVTAADTTPPGAPILATPNRSSNDTTPAVTGTAEAGTTVSLLENGAVIGTAIVGLDGTFAVSPASPLGQGGHTFTVNDTDLSGNVGPASATIVITIDTTAPTAPNVTSGGGSTNDTTPAIIGTAEAGTAVILIENGSIIGTAPVGQNGAFTLSPTTPLGQGNHTLTVQDVDPAGNVSTSSVPIGLVVDTSPPTSPIVTSPSGPTNDTTPLIAGFGEPGTTIVLIEGGSVIGQGVVDPNGTFSVTPTHPLDEGSHTIAVQSVDAAGNISSASQIGTTIASDGPKAVIAGVSGPNNLVGHAVFGALDPQSGATSVTVNDGATVLGTAALDAQGQWTLPFTFQGGGPSHTYNLVATATDRVGHVGASDTLSFVLDSTPNQPDFGTITHDVHSAGGEVYALYEGLLGRAPDATGLEFWADAFAYGVNPTVLAAGFLASQEGMARAGAVDNQTFVSQLYNATLHRNPDSVGLNFWTDALGSGISRADVGVGFSLSPEHLASLQPDIAPGLFVPDADASAAARIYYTVLSRAPDEAGLKFWADAFRAGTPLSAETAGFLDTPEAQAKTAGLSTAQFVDLIYTNSLGRHAEVSGLQFWTNAIDGHVASRVDVTTQIGQSVEAQSHLAPLIEQGWHLS